MQLMNNDGLRAVVKNHNKPHGGAEGEAPTAWPVEGATRAPEIDVEAELKKFEAEEKKRLGVTDEAPTQHWQDEKAPGFFADQRAHTTIFVSGLTLAHDLFVKSSLSGLGYNIQALDCPDNAALQYGKEFGNRGQCNPTYFTVGNLVKKLVEMRDKQGMTTEEIITKYAFLTAGACGPCRFGMYATEYRKALRDAGFDGFRVLLFSPNGGVEKATGREEGLKLDREFFTAIGKAIFTGDALNVITYRIRPFEVEKGSTDKALEACRSVIMASMQNRTSLLKALWKCRKLLQAVKVDRTLVKPKVSVIGEFWAMTTEGDGNYHLQRFLEEEGAEVDIQPIVNWILYNIWQGKVDTRRRMTLRDADTQAKRGLKNTKVAKKFAILWVADKAVRVVFHLFGGILGLRHYHLPNLDDNARAARDHYNTDLRGGEGHMEVGKLVQSVEKKKAHMVISVKPFGCMPSSGVSDGVQSIITEKYPEAIFLPIETTGDGAVNVYSRIQMMLFKAKRVAEEEYATTLKAKKTTAEKMAKVATRQKWSRGIHYSPHVVAGTAANFLHEAA